ncbi:MAG: retropepsin-like domain-containing protein [Oscillospiraceae bacterium]|nr:retropepsin-like domain-containing protein [Oscillospiraceae bacterium]
MIEITASFDYVLRIETKIESANFEKPPNLTMVYDPGSGTTCISKEVADIAGYKIYPLPTGEEVVGIGGEIEPGYTIIPNLILGGVSLGPVYVHVIEFHTKLAQRTSALIGMNVLSWFKITQDCNWNDEFERYTTATLTFEPKFDINDIPSLDKFSHNKRGQRFGTAFLVM